MFGLFKGTSGNGGSGKGPDFSHVDSADKAREMVQRGELEPLLLLPEQFGGTPVAPNVVYVPVGIAALKAQTDQNVVAPLAANGTITRYSATPSWAGSSHVPVSIEITAHDPGQFNFTLHIWGDAVAQG